METAHPTPEQVRAERLVTIGRAVDHLTTTDELTLRKQFADTTIRDKWKQNPKGLIRRLSEAGTPSGQLPLAVAYFGARSVLRAAGIPERP